MKKIESVIKKKNFPTIKTYLNAVGTYIIDKRNLDDSQIYDKNNGSRIGSTGLKSIPLAKIETEYLIKMQEEFMLEMDEYTEDLKDKDEILQKKK